jgi:hypothetical protein
MLPPCSGLSEDAGNKFLQNNDTHTPTPEDYSVNIKKF